MVFLNHRRLAIIVVALSAIGALIRVALVSREPLGNVVPETAPEPVHPPVVIDPGHGGIDGGAIHGSVSEKGINLDIAIRLTDALEELGVASILTRNEDLHLSELSYRQDLQHRLDVATGKKAWALVGIHANASDNPASRGFWLLYKENDEASKHLAEQIASSLSRFRPDLPISVKVERNHYYFDNSPCATVVVETGFLTNLQDREALLREDYREGIARAIAQGINSALQNPSSITNSYGKSAVTCDL